MSTRAKKPKQRKHAAPEKKKSTDVASEDRKAKLGAKHVCFSCKTRFYDLNKSEPICPKCGSDQRKKPKEDASSPAPPQPVKRPPPRPMPGLLDDEEEAVVPSFEDEMDLDITELDTGGEELFEEDAEAAEGAEDEFEEP